MLIDLMMNVMVVDILYVGHVRMISLGVVNVNIKNKKNVISCPIVTLLNKILKKAVNYGYDGVNLDHIQQGNRHYYKIVLWQDN